ncbi:MAG: hypothetical protein JNL67_00995 [Planctomycetaceae bacterium]|nr:hypothetical protein [Planctomycetaceae bacterium]
MKVKSLIHKLTAIAAMAFATLAGPTQAQINNVQAALEGELLVVTGDDLANAITISRNIAGDVFVTGRNGTTINGLPSVRFRQAVLNSVEVLMNGGNDNVVVQNLIINNDLYLNLGDGSDTLLSGSNPTTVGGNLSVEGGMGNDVIRLTGWSVGSDVYLDGQIGSLNCVLTGLTVGFGLFVIGDDTRDVISVNGCTSGDFASIQAKGGSDSVTVTSYAGWGLMIGTDAGADTIALSSVATLEDISITTGTENDSVKMTNVSSQKNIVASLDAGNDLLDGVRVSAQYDAVFEGGAGLDTFIDGGIAGVVKTEVKEFEIFP